MLERAELNMSICDSVNPRNFACPKMVVAVLHVTRVETFLHRCQLKKVQNS